MKFTCETIVLARVLSRFMKMVPRGSEALTATIKIVATVAGSIVLRIVHRGAMLQAELPAYVEAVGWVSIVPAALAEFMEAIASPGRVIAVEHHSAPGEIEVTSHAVQQKLATASDEGEAIPLLEDKEIRSRVRVPMGELRHALDRLAPVITGTPIAGSVDCVCLDIDPENQVVLVATDSVRLAMVGVSGTAVESDVADQRAWNLRAADVRLLTALLRGEAPGQAEMLLELGSGYCRALWSGYQLSIPLAEQEFPRWRSIRPASFTNLIEADAAELGGLLRLLEKVADRKRATVRFRWNGEQEAILAAGDRLAGTQTEMSLSLRWKARDAVAGSELAISARLLEPLVKRCGAGRVELAFTSPSLPARVRPATGDVPVEYLVMPINL